MEAARPLTQLSRTSFTRGQHAGSGGVGPEVPLLVELEAHAAVEMPDFPASRYACGSLSGRSRLMKRCRDKALIFS